ncbi:hypothetical protein GCM10028815_33470 [Mariniluteicoccus flavus]
MDERTEFVRVRPPDRLAGDLGDGYLAGPDAGGELKGGGVHAVILGVGVRVGDIPLHLLEHMFAFSVIVGYP